jgi:hypothetical protein
MTYRRNIYIFNTRSFTLALEFFASHVKEFFRTSASNPGSKIRSKPVGVFSPMSHGTSP